MQHMQKLSRTAITELIEQAIGQPVATIYIPMHKSAAPPHMSENQIRYKNCLNTAADRLQEQGSTHTAKMLRAHLDEMLSTIDYWEQPTSGVLLCAWDESLASFQLPIETEEYVAVDTCFHLAPILALLEDAQSFYVLGVVQHAPALYQGDMYTLEPSGISLPASLERGLNIDENNQKSEQQRSVAGQGAVRQGANKGGLGFNGRGGARNPAEEDRLRFFRMIDAMVCEKADTALPLVLCGIEAETAEYRSISKYPHILKKTVAGSYGAADLPKTYHKALAIVREEVINTKHQAAIDEYERVRGAHPERVAIEQTAIEAAATQGRIDKLLLALEQHTRDTVQDARDAVPRITFPHKSAARINNLAQRVWQMSGSIISLDRARMPEAQSMVARLRY